LDWHGAQAGSTDSSLKSLHKEPSPVTRPSDPLIPA
jgi:hypothetical protein